MDYVEDKQTRNELEAFIKFKLLINGERLSDKEIDRLIDLANILFCLEKDSFVCSNCQREFLLSHLEKPDLAE